MGTVLEGGKGGVLDTLGEGRVRIFLGEGVRTFYTDQLAYRSLLIFIHTMYVAYVLFAVWMHLILMHMKHFKHLIISVMLYNDACKRNKLKLVFCQE